MFSRNVTYQVKPNQGREVGSKFTNEIVPILRKANGFRDHISMFREGNEAVGITLWDTKAQLEAYLRDTDPSVVKLLQPLINGNPDVRTYEVSTSTAHKFPTV